MSLWRNGAAKFLAALEKGSGDEPNTRRLQIVVITGQNLHRGLGDALHGPPHLFYLRRRERVGWLHPAPRIAGDVA